MGQMSSPVVPATSQVPASASTNGFGRQRGPASIGAAASASGRAATRSPVSGSYGVMLRSVAPLIDSHRSVKTRTRSRNAPETSAYPLLVSYRVVIPRSIPFDDANRVQREVWKRGYSTRLAGRDTAVPGHQVVEFLRMIDDLPDPGDVSGMEQDPVSYTHLTLPTKRIV